MEYIQVGDLDFKISRIILGTWAIGGWQWGGTDEEQSIATIRKAIDMGATTIDTAPIYGFGKSEELVGRAVKQYGNREELQIATKLGLEWDENQNVRRNSSRERILKEIDDSLQRLQTDYIDIYQIHWPDLQTNFKETAETMAELLGQGKIRAIGVSNYTSGQIEVFQRRAPVHTSQPPYNLFERGIEKDLLPYCLENNITLLTYGALCRGLLSGKMNEDWEFQKGDLRRNTDPKFQGKTFKKHLEAVKRLKKYASEQLNKKVLHLAVRWVLDKGVHSAIWGARRPEQVTFDRVDGWQLTPKQIREIEHIVEDTVADPVAPAFMAPPE